MKKFQSTLQGSVVKYTFKKSLLLLTVFLFCVSCEDKQSKTLLFVGSFTDKKTGKGIYVYEFDEETGKSELKSTVDNVINTSYLELSSSGKYLYSVVDAQMSYNGKVAAYKVNVENAKLDMLNMQNCGGLNPAHLEVNKTGELLVNSNYSDGSLSLFKIKGDGRLEKHSQLLHFKDSSIIKSRQRASHIHSANFSPDGKFIFAHDLGADKIRRFSIIKNRESVVLKNPKEINTKLGSGPRHFTFHQNGKFGYLANELNGKVDLYNYRNGNLIFVEDYPSYSQEQDIYRTADIHISPDGKFLYISNRGPKEDSISVFQIDQENGKLTIVERINTGGKHPRNFEIHPSGEYVFVANMFTDNIVVFQRNQETGKLTKLDEEIKVNNPSSIQIKVYNNRNHL